MITAGLGIFFLSIATQISMAEKNFYKHLGVTSLIPSCLLGLIVGIFFTSNPHFACLLASIIFGFAAYKRSYVVSMIFILCAFAGIYRYQSVQRSADQCIKYLATQKNICGSVVSKKKKRQFLHVYGLQVDQANCVNSEIALLFFESKNPLNIGDSIQLRQPVLRCIKNDTPFKNFLLKNKACAYLHERDVEDIWVIKRPAFSWLRYLDTQRNRLLWKCKKGLSWVSKNIVGLVFFGSKNEPSAGDISHLFNLWGIVHYVARSGLHIVMLLSSWQYLFRFIPVPLFAKDLLAVLFVVIYDLLTFSSLSFSRAYYTFVFDKAQLWLTGRSNVIHALFFIACMTVWINPFVIFGLDFQLSYGLTAALLLLGKLI